MEESEFVCDSPHVHNEVDNVWWRTQLPVVRDQGYRNFEIQIGPLDRWRHRNMRPTIPNSHEN